MGLKKGDPVIIAGFFGLEKKGVFVEDAKERPDCVVVETEIPVNSLLGVFAKLKEPRKVRQTIPRALVRLAPN